MFKKQILQVIDSGNNNNNNNNNDSNSNSAYTYTYYTAYNNCSCDVEQCRLPVVVDAETDNILYEKDAESFNFDFENNNSGNSNNKYLLAYQCVDLIYKSNSEDTNSNNNFNNNNNNINLLYNNYIFRQNRTIGREANSQLCLRPNEAKNFGAERCAFGFCID